MNTDRDQNKKKQQQTDQDVNEPREKQRSGAFKETRGDEKSTTNVEEEAELEQERKEAMTERD